MARELVNFETRGHATITMFDDVARSLLKMMGQSGVVPGAIGPEDITGALQRLQTSLRHTDGEQGSSADTANEEDENDEPISLKNRAIPLIGLLEAAQKQDASVTWQNPDQSV